jgi:hypothetical protein
VGGEGSDSRKQVVVDRERLANEGPQHQGHKQRGWERSTKVLPQATAPCRSVRVQRLDSDLLEQRALTMGMFVAPMVAIAPIAEGYHYVLVVPALLIGWWWTFQSPAATKKRLLLAACTALTSQLQEGWLALLAYPRMYGALALWGLLARALVAPRASR